MELLDEVDGVPALGNGECIQDGVDLCAMAASAQNQSNDEEKEQAEEGEKPDGN